MNGAAAGGRHVFLVRSSLQFLLAAALAADAREHTQQQGRMLFLPDLLDPGLFLRAADAWAESPFDRVVFVEPRSGSGAIRRELRAALAEARPLSLTVFNDREEAGQTALIAAARRFPQAQRFCAEDGSLAYTSFAYRAHGASTRLRQTLRLGRRWSDVRVLGTHPLVQHFVALHPQLLRAELRARPVRPFPAAALESPALRSLAKALCAGSGFDPLSVPAGATVLTLSHSDYAARNPDYRQMVAACARRLGGRPGRFFVKYHPRETAADYLGLCAPGVATEIARTLPVECLYLMLRDRPLSVIGGMSTTLLTAGLLMPQVRCAALVHASASGDHWDRQLLDALRITPLADAAAVCAFLDTCPA
ncbi:MAG TPA: hypothetical protein PKB14_10060 [Rubrivivax sp.]|mgnify:CR=1 FL=1|nr:hypothetical protein [Rubrivivax sp.]